MGTRKSNNTATGSEEDFIEIRMKASEFDRISNDVDVDIITPKDKPRPFTIPFGVDRLFGHTETFRALLEKGNIRAIDHREFQKCADKLVSISGMSDGGTNRLEAVCLQRCRRGGKTFMATAVASRLEELFKEDDQAPFVIFITTNGTSRLSRKETAMSAILARVAYEIQNSKEVPFYQFLKHYSNFDAVAPWIERNNVILLIDELNIIATDREHYEDMSLFLDALVGREGSALLYTTHHRLEDDLRHGREDTDDPGNLSMRPHYWQPMPRLNTPGCIRYMKREEHFWSAVMRGRIPALLVLEQQHIPGFMHGNQPDNVSRRLMFNAILDGNIQYLEEGRNIFRAYAYLLQNEDGEPTHVWPPFMCAQPPVLGKPCRSLRAVLESPDVNKPKAFEALAELAVVIQLMSSTPRYRDLIPQHSRVSQDNSFDATAILEIGAEVTNIKDLRDAVEHKLTTENERYAQVLQILVIPLFEEFPIYDFFLFHRHRGPFGGWMKCSIAAGYQCKMGSKYPDKDHKAEGGVGKSVWIEGRGPLTRKISGEAHGWKLLSKQEHRKLFGESLYAALPVSGAEDEVCEHCSMERTLC